MIIIKMWSTLRPIRLPAEVNYSRFNISLVIHLCMMYVYGQYTLRVGIVSSGS